jgi:hypothetical protein
MGRVCGVGLVTGLGVGLAVGLRVGCPLMGGLTVGSVTIPSSGTVGRGPRVVGFSLTGGAMVGRGWKVGGCGRKVGLAGVGRAGVGGRIEGGLLMGGLAVVRGPTVVNAGPLVGGGGVIGRGLVVGSVSSGGLLVGEVGGPLTGGPIVGRG